MSAILLKYWKEIVIVAILVAAGLWVKHLVTTVEKQKKTIITHELTIEGLNGSIKNQNDAVDQLKKDSDKRLSDAKVLLEKAQKEAKVYKQRAIDLGKTAPQFPGDLCRSADVLINEELRK